MQSLQWCEEVLAPLLISYFFCMFVTLKCFRCVIFVLYLNLFDDLKI